ncbi:CpsD/CapB family tyrosine-protein kinase [Cellulomonas hominis]|uniref:CpsD/CapB family tyrosine-protein kinase n=1 Tax=Cellulomonas hominis TaxID=156981 RepID=UPI00144487F7|nr:CpsD/CapB family tyrosine-protein kinase [Cellulomonas hominis]NKY09158.1 CpsD/CapB family tyrosine-protein kinase [Cellulomonas hominis]
MTLQDLFRTIWFGRWLVVVALVAALAGSWYFVSAQEPQHEAHATVQIVDADTLAAAGVRLDSDPSLVNSNGLARVAAAELGEPGLARRIAQHAVGEYVGDAQDTVLITMTEPEPDEAVAMVNSVADAYVAELQKQFDASIASMQERLGALAETISQQQAAITANRVADAAAASAAAAAGRAVAPEPVDGLQEAQYATSMDQYQTLSTQLAQAQLLVAPADLRQNALSADLVSMPTTLVYAIGALAGLLLGVGLAVVRRGLDNKVRTLGAARRAAGAHVLGRLTGSAAAIRMYDETGELPVAQRSATAYTRTVRELRTALQAGVEESGSAVIVVTAADLHTPRSFVAANLAASWALSGRRVVALSGDLRQPRLNDLLPAVDGGEPEMRDGEPAEVGLATAIPHLRVQPPLRTELDPADYLASDEVRELIDRLRASADIVVIDAPPMLVAADAAILGAYADGVLLAATLGHTAITALEDSADRLRTANAQLLGVALDASGDDQRRYEATYPFAGDAADRQAAQGEEQTAHDAQGEEQTAHDAAAGTSGSLGAAVPEPRSNSASGSDARETVRTDAARPGRGPGGAGRSDRRPDAARPEDQEKRPPAVVDAP